MKEKNIAVWLIVSILTCGIGGIVWFVSITDDTGYLSGDRSVSGGMALVLTIVTCGIYGIYWNYKMGKLLYQARDQKGIKGSDNSVLYLILCLLGVGIINYCLMQDEINKLVEVK